MDAVKAKPGREDYQLSHNYRDAKLDCDLVMKGGVSSGVFYPWAICKIAERYRFHNIGGASAGAIAAGVAAAAEYARRENELDPDHGFARLEQLPGLLGEELPSGKTRLLSLFQPTSGTRDVFDFFLAALGPEKGFAKVMRFNGLVCGRQTLLPILAFVVAVAVVWTAVASGGGFAIVASLVAAAFTVVAGIIGAWALFALGTYRNITASFGGICTGGPVMEASRDQEPPLCVWLERLIDDASGKNRDDGPLTFGDLRKPGKHPIELAMITTNLTHGRPYRLPFTDEVFFFRPREFASLFSPAVVQWLESKGRARMEASEQIRAIVDASPDDTYLPLPESDDLPVIVAVRLSLSFPILLSAVPLYAVDWTRVAHPELEDARTSTSRPDAECPKEGRQKLERCWFSDGGICSNLPIHFFDALLPKKPTFALNLRAPHVDYPVVVPNGDYPPGKSELDNVWIPESKNSGFAERWDRVDGHELSPIALLTRLINTMQNWNDNALAKAPGYRDRILHISHNDNEGGLNLDMPSEVIDRLSQRGAAAGFKIRNRFDPETDNGWEHQLWVRYRSALAMLQGLLRTAHVRYFADGHERLDKLVANPPPPHVMNDEERVAAKEVNDKFSQFMAFTPKAVNFQTHAPRPWSELRARPRGD